jgi:hypothetical protein
MIRTTRLALALAAVAACGDRNDARMAGASGGSATAQPSGPTGDPTILRPSGPTDAPQQFACTKDEDCTVAVTTPGADPCCEMTVTALPVNAKWLAFMATWREGHCAGVTCPDLALPGEQLAPCGYDARCIDESCSNACGVIPPTTPLTELPPYAPKRLGCREDSDCMILGNAPSTVNACCEGPAAPAPISRSFFEFVVMWRLGSCKDLQCPPRDAATFELSACARHPRCVKRSCTDACNAPPRRRRN